MIRGAGPVWPHFLNFTFLKFIFNPTFYEIQYIYQNFIHTSHQILLKYTKNVIFQLKQMRLRMIISI